MASILDSFRDISTEKLSFLKILLLTIPVYYSYLLYTQSRGDFSNFSFWAIITSILVFGFLIQVTGSVINDKSSIIPSMNPLTLAFSATKGLIAIGPVVFLACFLANFICSFINFMPWVNISLKTLIWLIFSSVIIASFLIFSNSEKITDAYRIRVIFQKAGDLILTIVLFIFQLFFLNLVTTGFIGYVIYILIGYSPIFTFFVLFAIVFNLAIFGHYWGQVHHETLNFDNPN